MSKYSEFVKSVKEKEISQFFGEIKRISNSYFTFKRFINEDNFILITSDVQMIKENYVLIVGPDKAVYLKSWNIKKIHNYDLGINAFAVKLSRQFFKPYTFKKEFSDYIGTCEYSFDGLKEIAKKQDVENMKIALGHMYE